jgi:hypothetical protein
MKYIKTYESSFIRGIEDIELFQRVKKLKMIKDAIVALFQYEKESVSSNYFEEGYDTIVYEIIIDNGDLPLKTRNHLFQIEHFITEPLIMIMCYKTYNEDITNFIKYVAEDFDEIDYYTTEHWSVIIDLDKVPDFVEKLSVKNFEIYTSANKYNL